MGVEAKKYVAMGLRQILDVGGYEAYGCSQSLPGMSFQFGLCSPFRLVHEWHVKSFSTFQARVCYVIKARIENPTRHAIQTPTLEHF